MTFTKKIESVFKEVPYIDESRVACYSDLEDTFDRVEDLSGASFIVAYEEFNETWMDFIFLELSHYSNDEAFYSELCRVSGPSDGLRECRHTHFADDGYVLYMSGKNMIAMIEFLSKFYDMD